MFFKGVSYIKSIHIRKEVKLAWLVVWAAAAAAGSSGTGGMWCIFFDGYLRGLAGGAFGIL